MKCSVLLLLFLSAFDAHADDKRVILLSVDGLRPDFYLEPAAHGAELPNIRALMREGVYAEGVIGTYPSVTYPSHTSIVTGVRPGEHGILNNYVFDESGRFDDWYWYAESLRRPTLWDVARGTTAAVYWPVTVGADIDLNYPEFWIPDGNEAYRSFQAELTTPELLSLLESELGPLPGEAPEEEALEDFVFQAGELLLRQHRPELLLLHVINTDTKQHRHGREHREVSRAFERVDARIGRLRRTLASLGLADETLFVVTGDHGFIQTHTRIHLNVAFRDAGLLELGPDGGVQEWRAMTWPAGGSAAIVLKEEGDSKTREAVEALLDRLLGGPLDSLVSLVPEAIRARHGAMPGAAFVLEAEEGYVFGTNREGKLLTPSSDLGHHGHLPDHPRMKTGFLMVGPGVRRGVRVPVMRQIDIAPTIAHWAGWDVGDVDGIALVGLFEEDSETER